MSILSFQVMQQQIKVPGCRPKRSKQGNKAFVIISVVMKVWSLQPMLDKGIHKLGRERNMSEDTGLFMANASF